MREVRSHQYCAVQIRPAEVRLAEVGLAEVGPAEVRPAEVRPAEVRPAERGRGEAGLAEIGLAELRKNSWIEAIAEAGLDGLEIWHPKHNPDQRKYLLETAKRLDLVPSGGSDYHGASVGDSMVGQEPVPLECVDRLRERRPRT